MLQVHVWLPDQEHVGHAAISFEKDYVSFWPEDSAGKKDLKIKRSQPGHFMESLSADIEAEGDRRPITVNIHKYKGDKLKDFIETLQTNKPRYQLAKNNCSHIVAECLHAATDEKASFVPDAAVYGRLGKVLGRGIWTPDQVLRYARELAAKSIKR